MDKFISNVVLIIITSIVFILLYNYWLDGIKANYAKEIIRLNYQNQSIDRVLSKYQRSITITDLENFDKESGTHLSEMVVNTKTVPMSYSAVPTSDKKNNSEGWISEVLGSLRSENTVRAEGVYQQQEDFGSILPPITSLLLTGVGIFLSTLIINLGNTSYKGAPLFLCWLYRLFKRSLD